MAEKTTTIKNALIENNKLVAAKLKTLDEKKVDKALVEDTTSRYKVLSDNNFNDTYKHQLDVMDTTIASDITNAINELDVVDIANDRQYVSGVSEEDGKITVTRAEHLGGVINVEDDSEIASKVTETYYSKFLFSDKSGNLHYDSAIAGKVGRRYTLATAEQITAVKNLIAANLPHNERIRLTEITNDTYIELYYQDSAGALFIDKYIGGTIVNQYNTVATNPAWSAGTPPSLLITQDVVDTVVRLGFIIDRILAGVNFQDRIIITSTEVVDNVDNTNRCVTSRAVKAKLDEMQAVINILTKKLNEVIAAHNGEGESTLDVLAYDSDGNIIDPVAVDEDGAEIDTEVIGD